MERNLQSLKTTAIVYSNFLLIKRRKLRGHITGRSQLTLQQSTKHKTKLSWARHIRCMERNQMSKKEQIQLSSQVPEVWVLHNFSGHLWILSSIKCLLKTILNYCRWYSFPRKIFISLECFFVLNSRSKFEPHSCWVHLEYIDFGEYQHSGIQHIDPTLLVRKLIVFSKKVKKKRVKRIFLKNWASIYHHTLKKIEKEGLWT